MMQIFKYAFFAVGVAALIAALSGKYHQFFIAFICFVLFIVMRKNQKL
jgi:hypothetical protein